MVKEKDHVQAALCRDAIVDQVFNKPVYVVNHLKLHMKAKTTWQCRADYISYCIPQYAILAASSALRGKSYMKLL